jgi:Glucodextranase, domain B
VTAGKQSIAAKGAPSSPRPISVDVMLRVVDPGCRVQREAFAMIHGRTDPGALVFGNDTQGVVRSDGKFKVNVPLKIGKNKIVVVTEDAAGNRRRRVFRCITVDPGAPIKKIDINWGPAKTQEQT